MIFDRVGEFAFFPKTADANDAAQGLDRFGDLTGNFFRITGIGFGIQNEQAVVNVFLSQFIAPNIWTTSIVSKVALVARTSLFHF